MYEWRMHTPILLTYLSQCKLTFVMIQIWNLKDNIVNIIIFQLLILNPACIIEYFNVTD